MSVKKEALSHPNEGCELGFEQSRPVVKSQLRDLEMDKDEAEAPDDPNNLNVYEKEELRTKFLEWCKDASTTKGNEYWGSPAIDVQEVQLTDMPAPACQSKAPTFHGVDVEFNPKEWVLNNFVVYNKSGITVDVFVTATPVQKLLKELSFTIGKTEAGFKAVFELLKQKTTTGWAALVPGERTAHTLDDAHVTVLSQGNALLGFCVDYYVRAGRKLLVFGNAQKVPVQRLMAPLAA